MILLQSVTLSKCFASIGGACRSRVSKYLAKHHSTLTEAEDALGIDYVLETSNDTNFVDHISSTPKQFPQTNVGESLSPIFSCSPQKKASISNIGDLVKNLVFAFQNTMTKRLKMQLLRYLYKQIVIESGGTELATFVRPNFLDVSLDAMKTLQTGKKENLVYGLSICFKRKDNDESETRMPLQRMPFGLVDYNIKYFSSHSSQKLKMEDHYAKWLETMYAHFGNKWLCLFRGPYWQYEEKVNPESAYDLPLVNSMQVDSDLVPTSNNMEVVSVQSAGIQVSNSMDKSSHDNTHSSNSIIDDVLAELQINLEEFEFSAMDEESNNIVEEESVPSCDIEMSNSLPTEQCQQQVEVCVSPEAMEVHHKIQPQQSNRKPVNSCLYDTMKVCLTNF